MGLVRPAQLVQVASPNAGQVVRLLHDLMREVNRQDGATFLICTNDESVTARCTRRLTLADGRLSANIARPIDGPAPPLAPPEA